MTTNEYISKLNKKIEDIVKFDKPLLLAVKSVMAVQAQRIFIKGKNANDANIGEYKNKELYVNPNRSPKKFPAKGKYGKTKFENGLPHKTGYFVNYLAYKQKIGRNKIIKSVDLFLFGETQKDWSNSEVLKNAKAVKYSPHLYTVELRKHNLDKTDRYGNVFGLTKNERKLFIDVLNEEFKKALR